mmetsp:Transcript_92013/g.274596  ORF Transcript_92013/g.274596 Transcript_92013/m.274596 type:complete len:230 (-) Transcript_92013:260-949(-)
MRRGCKAGRRSLIARRQCGRRCLPGIWIRPGHLPQRPLLLVLGLLELDPNRPRPLPGPVLGEGQEGQRPAAHPPGDRPGCLGRSRAKEVSEALPLAQGRWLRRCGGLGPPRRRGTSARGAPRRPRGAQGEGRAGRGPLRRRPRGAQGEGKARESGILVPCFEGRDPQGTGAGAGVDARARDSQTRARGGAASASCRGAQRRCRVGATCGQSGRRAVQLGRAGAGPHVCC